MAKLIHTEKKETLRGRPGAITGDNAESGEEAEAKPGSAGQAGQESDAEGIVITKAAAEAIQRQRDKRGTADAAIRVGLRGGGCSGFSYHFDWAEGPPGATDQIFEGHGATIYVDAKSFSYLKGMVLDYQTGLMGHGFQFNNPNAKGSCGCGESVQF